MHSWDPSARFIASSQKTLETGKKGQTKSQIPTNLNLAIDLDHALAVGQKLKELTEIFETGDAVSH